MRVNHPQPSQARLDQGELLSVRRTAYGAELTEPAGGEESPPGVSAPPGAVRRDVGHRRVAQTAGSESFLKLAAAAIDELRDEGITFTAETVRARTPVDPPNANLLGVAIRRARLLGLIIRDGTETARRPEAHSRLIQAWRGRRD